MGILGSLCPPGSRRAHGCTAEPPQPRKTPALWPSKSPQPTPATCHLEMLQPCTEPPRPPSARAPTQPLRMVFTRLDRSCWSSRFLAAPSFFLPRSQDLLRALLPPTCWTEPVSVAPGVSSTVTYRCPHPQKTLRVNEPAPGLGHCPPPHCTLTGRLRTSGRGHSWTHVGNQHLLSCFAWKFLGPQRAAPHAPGALHRHPPPKTHLTLFFREICVLWQRVVFPLECQFSLLQIGFPINGGKFESALVTPLEIESKMLMCLWCTHVCLWGFGIENPLWALQMDILFSPEMSFSRLWW